MTDRQAPDAASTEAPGSAPGSAARPAPIRSFLSDRLVPDPDSQRQLDELARKPGVREVTVLPDVHYKDRNPTPSGTVAVGLGCIMPRAVDDGFNCGMRSMVTSVKARDITVEVMDELFRRLIERLPLKAHEQPLLTAEQCEDVMVNGLSSMVGPLGLPADELDRTEHRGSIRLGLDPEAIRAALPKKAIAKERGAIGTLGAGNHFLELQEVVEILDEEAAKRLGIELGDAMFMMHSDSRRLGKKLIKKVQAEAEALYREEGGNELWSMPVDTELGQRYLACMTASLHAGFANRAAITHILRQTMREVLGDESFQLRLVCDSGHETILPEEHAGQTVWVHRHGASHAIPPSDRVSDPALADLGQPVPLAGCLGMDSYICLPGPNVGDTFHSGPHGAGRVLSKSDSADRYDPDEVEADVRERGVRLYRYHSENIAGQSPRGFKDVSHVVDAVREHGVLRPVVRLRPLAALKG